MTSRAISAACPVCAGVRVETLSTSVGERSYCLECFHGWRTQIREYAYEDTAMCSRGTSPARLESQVDFFAPFAPPRAKILEIGCATGELAAASKRRLDIEEYAAIELSPAAAEAEQRVDRLFRQPLGALLGAGTISPGFDLAIISHVLEHLEHPYEELQAIRHILKDDGALFIEVPNLSGNTKLPIDDNCSHIHFFSAGSLTRLLAKVGLEPVSVATGARLDARYSDSLRIMARPFATPRWRKGFLSDHPAIAAERNMVVWGAGSLAQEILANFFDLDRIEFFIDRDPAKQATPCLDRPVLGPESLGQTARTVLINSIDFADEIAADIARLFPQAGHRLIRIGDLLEDVSPSHSHDLGRIHRRHA